MELVGSLSDKLQTEQAGKIHMGDALIKKSLKTHLG